MTDYEQLIVAILGWLWLFLWVGAIWIEEYRIKLFITGLFLMIIALCGQSHINDKRKLSDLRKN